MAWYANGPDSRHGLTGKFNLFDTMNSSSLLEATLRRDRQVVIVTLVVVIAVCWLYLLAGAGTGMYPRDMDGLGSTMQGPGWTPGYTLLMFAMWWLMMIAMMLPSAAPMVLLHAAVTRNGLPPDDGAVPAASSRQILPGTTAFVGGYLVVWGAFSLVAVIAQWILEREGLLSPMMTSTSRLLGSGLLLSAGLWQLTPLKTVCLRQCRSPIGFVSMHWRSGIRGAFAMGVKHGSYCLGCCWFLMGLLFYGGVMNLIWISGLALFVLVEKVLPGGDFIGRAAGVLLIAWGAWLGLTTT